MKFLIGTFVGSVLALTLYATTLRNRVVELEDKQSFILQWQLLQKMRADEIECFLGNAFGRVDCDGIFK